MDVTLIIITGKTGTKEIALRRPKIIGRAKTAAIVIPHPQVNERHCLLFEHDGLLMIQDLNSQHGTVVGGRKVVQAPLPPGAEFTVGPLRFRTKYAYGGNLEALPKTIYAEPLPATVIPRETPKPSVEGAAPAPTPAPAPAEPAKATSPPSSLPVGEESPANGDAPSFFNWGTASSDPAAPTPAAAGEPEAFPSFFTGEKPSPAAAPVVDFPTPPVPAAPAEVAAEAETVEDVASKQPPPAPKPEEPPKKKQGLIDFFSHRPSRRRRLVGPVAIDVSDGGNGAVEGPQPESPAKTPPAKPASAKTPPAKREAWADETPNVAAMTNPPVKSAAETTDVPADTQDDLADFFKKLQQ